jgi:hypothetical protein
VTWDENSLEYGYVLSRASEGGWWHLHFGRSSWVYHCELLARRTDVLVCVQRFSVGAMAQSPRFLLTLDGEGVELSAEEVEMDFRWGQRPEVADLVAEALHFQREIMPLLHDNSAFQQAAAEIVARQRYSRVAASGKLTRAERRAVADRPRD